MCTVKSAVTQKLTLYERRVYRCEINSFGTRVGGVVTIMSTLSMYRHVASPQ